MELKRELTIKLKDGLHTRVIAAIAREAIKIEQKYDVKLYIEYEHRGITPIGAVMSFIFFKVRQGEAITIYAKGNGDLNSALNEIEPFFGDKINDFLSKEIKDIDIMITDKAITFGEIINYIDNGVIVEDLNGEITFINSATPKLLGIEGNEIIGSTVASILGKPKKISPQSSSQIYRREKDGKRFIIYKNKLIIENEDKGNIYVLENVSMLEEVIEELSIVKELKEKLQLIIDTVGDGICVINNKGIITYVNNNYKKMVDDEELLGKNIVDISPEGLRNSVLETGVAKIGEIVKKRNCNEMICSVYPLKVEDEQVGVVSIAKEISNVKKLTEKLDKASERVKYLEQELIRTRKPHQAFDKYIGKSGKILDSLALATKAAKSNATVIIRGESGTGKELIAEGIHYASNKSEGPFIRVNCAAIPETLIESELFGYEKGAFTGAVKRKLGKFELAQNGTIFLDEIGEMDKNTQSKILRVLQYKEFQRVGGESTVKVNVRIIAATHRNLEDMVREGEFREDLYYRLNVIPVILAPLRDRKEDIPLLAEHFIDKLKGDKKIIGITNDAMNKFMEYTWRGNVRELENVIERIIALCEEGVIGLDDLPMHILDDKEYVTYSRKSELNIEGNQNEEKAILEESQKVEKICGDEIENIIKNDKLLTMKEYEKIIIEKALIENGSYNKAAKALGLTHRTVSVKAKQYGIEKIITWK
ncbi:sigma 54-interacting transcriptional regulator [Clostridium gasigenes]|uniref:sigma 54-interacting transcriptional regulator n=1 Tax=Clostridium gasigenes TaxID=94869 RepID=UPI001C0C463C|nr:sigma 54-interacting transcriptional regulator [Clostridium gasigenes]MBU3109616.1 sigma 54-interacting transcriptional regulator [Clostridium gasigenes]